VTMQPAQLQVQAYADDPNVVAFVLCLDGEQITPLGAISTRLIDDCPGLADKVARLLLDSVTSVGRKQGWIYTSADMN